MLYGLIMLTMLVLPIPLGIAVSINDGMVAVGIGHNLLIFDIVKNTSSSLSFEERVLPIVLNKGVVAIVLDHRNFKTSLYIVKNGSSKKLLDLEGLVVDVEHVGDTIAILLIKKRPYVAVVPFPKPVHNSYHNKGVLSKGIHQSNFQLILLHIGADRVDVVNTINISTTHAMCSLFRDNADYLYVVCRGLERLFYITRSNDKAEHINVYPPIPIRLPFAPITKVYVVDPVRGDIAKKFVLYGNPQKVIELRNGIALIVSKPFLAPVIKLPKPMISIFRWIPIPPIPIFTKQIVVVTPKNITKASVYGIPIDVDVLGDKLVVATWRFWFYTVEVRSIGRGNELWRTMFREPVCVVAFIDSEKIAVATIRHVVIIANGKIVDERPFLGIKTAKILGGGFVVFVGTNGIVSLSNKIIEKKLPVLVYSVSEDKTSIAIVSKRLMLYVLKLPELEEVTQLSLR